MYQAGMHLQSGNVQNAYYTTAFPAQAAMQLPQQPSSLQLQPFYSPLPGSGRGFYQITGNTNQQNLPAYPSAYPIPSSTHVYYNQTYTPNNVTYPVQGTQYMENVHQGWYQTSGDSNTCGLDGEEPQVPLGNPLTATQEAHASPVIILDISEDKDFPVNSPSSMSFTSGNDMPIHASKEEEQSRKVSLDPNSPSFQPAGIVTEIAEGIERTCDCDKPSNALMVDDNTSDSSSLGPFTEDSVKMLNSDSHSHSDSCSFDFSFKNSSSDYRSSADQGHSPNPFERNCPDMLNDVTMNSEDSLDKSTGSYSSPDNDFEDTLDKNMCFTAEKEHSNVVNKVQMDKVSSEHSQTTEEKNPMNFLSLPEELFTPDYDSPEVTDAVSGMDFFYKVSTFDVCCDNDQFVGNTQPYQINQNWFRSNESHQAEITWSSIRAKRPNHFESSKPKLPPAENSKPQELLSENSKPNWAPNENSLTKWFPTEHSKSKQLPPENTKPKWSPAEHSKKKCRPSESSEPKRKNSEPKSSQLSTEVQEKPTLKLFQSLGKRMENLAKRAKSSYHLAQKVEPEQLPEEKSVPQWTPIDNPKAKLLPVENSKVEQFSTKNSKCLSSKESKRLACPSSDQRIGFMAKRAKFGAHSALKAFKKMCSMQTYSAWKKL